MPLDVTLEKHIEAALSVVDEHGTSGPRLKDDARRLWGRVNQLLSMGLANVAPGTVESEALELACHAVPNCRCAAGPRGRPSASGARTRPSCSSWNSGR